MAAPPQEGCRRRLDRHRNGTARPRAGLIVGESVLKPRAHSWPAVLAVAAALAALLPIGSASGVDARGPSDDTCQDRLFEEKASTRVDCVELETGTVEATLDALPAGFTKSVVFSTGLLNPTNIEFAADGRVFVAQKNGDLKVYDNVDDPTPTAFTDLRANVHNFWDRGLLGLALDPSLTNPALPSRPWVYVLYTYDHVLGGGGPVGEAGNDRSVRPRLERTADGCVVSAPAVALQRQRKHDSGPETVLIEDWCQQYPSHSVGSLGFGPEGALYASAGDGASFNNVDYGQYGGTLVGTPTPKNPCGDPPVDGMTPPTAEGGALRSQDLRTDGDPATLDGTVMRPRSGRPAMPTRQPVLSSSDPNRQRVIAYGLRNPFRFEFRPGTDELWVGDVGWSAREEIDRIADVNDATVENFGWPCYEGLVKSSRL